MSKISIKMKNKMNKRKKRRRSQRSSQNSIKQPTEDKISTLTMKLLTKRSHQPTKQTNKEGSSRDKAKETKVQANQFTISAHNF